MMHRILKIYKMPLNEVFFRLKEKLFNIIEKWNHLLLNSDISEKKFLKNISKPKNINKQTVINHIQAIKNVSFFIDTDDKADLTKLLNEINPGNMQEIIKKAELIYNHEFSFLGIDVKYHSGINWIADPVSLRLWPKLFYYDINISNGNNGYGDVKHVWELNRHQFLVDLGKAFWITGDDKYAEKFFELILDWIDQNPYKIGINWASILEVAVRSISWIWGYFFCMNSKSLTSETNLKFLKALYLHGSYIEKHLSYYSSPYNHLIGEATALYMIGQLFPEFKYSSRWKNKGWKILEREINNQFYKDGFTVEQASSYHRFTLEFYLMAILLKNLNDGDVPPEMWKMLENAIEICMYMIRPDGLISMIGDGDDGRAFYLSHGSHWDFRSLLSTGAVLFCRGDFKKLSDGISEDTLWLLGTEAFEKYQSIKEIEPEQKSRDFRASGYFIMRNSWNKDAHYLCFDCGEQSAGLFTDATSSAAHGHADLLSFELAVFGKSMLIDPGFYSYNNVEIPWMNYFRKTKAHNTIVIDGKDQSHHLGNMNWSNVAQHKIEQWISSKKFDFVEGSHDGYCHGANPVLHRRSIFFKKPEYWIITDYLVGNGMHTVESFFHFAKIVDLEIDFKSVWTKEDDQKNIIIQALDDSFDFEIIANENQLDPESGWIAKGYLNRDRSTILKYYTESILPVCSVIIILPFGLKKPSLKTNKIAVMQPDNLQKNDIFAFNIQTDDLSDYYLMNNKEHKNVSFDIFSTDAYMVFARKLKSELIELYIINGAYLEVGKSTIVNLKDRQTFLNISFIDKKPFFETS